MKQKRHTLRIIQLCSTQCSRSSKAHLGEHVLHLVLDFLVPLLLVASGVAVHLVHAHTQLAHAKQAQQARVLARLALHSPGQ